MSVIQLLSQLKAKEYNNCVDLYADGLYRFALKTMKDTHKAEDVVQETFAKFWEKKNQVDSKKVKSYLYTTAYRKMIDEFRRARKSEFTEAIENLVGQYTPASPDLQEVLNKALDRLQPVQKSVILLRDYEGYSYQEIAEITDLSESQVKVYIFRGRKLLRQYLGSIEAII